MIFYRYEKQDGGGPYYTRDGKNRIYNDSSSNDDTLDGCLSINDLCKWFSGKEEHIKNCTIKYYEGELIHYNSRTSNAIFKKSTARLLGVLMKI